MSDASAWYPVSLMGMSWLGEWMDAQEMTGREGDDDLCRRQQS